MPLSIASAPPQVNEAIDYLAQQLEAASLQGLGFGRFS